MHVFIFLLTGIDGIVIVETLPFFDLSLISGVEELSRQQDSNSDPIELPDFGILFGDEFVKEAYVSNACMYMYAYLYVCTDTCMYVCTGLVELVRLVTPWMD